jgi:hypothetical protein
LLGAVAVLATLTFVPASGAVPDPPVLHALSPTAVPAAGAMITVGGSRLDQVHSVSFGAKTVHAVQHVSASRLTVRAPKHTLGRVAVTLHSANGSSRSAHLSYVRAPSPLHWHRDSGIDPRRGELTGLSCVTEAFCVAVEPGSDGSTTRFLRFGTSSSPKSTTVPTYVGNVACGTNQFCVAALASDAYVWNGAHWTGPTQLSSNRQFTGGPVCARGTTTCVYWSTAKTLVHEASGWTSLPFPAGLQINDISCATADFCEALASQPDGSKEFVHYDGTSWQLDTMAPDKRYQEIACAAPSYCLATGAGAGSDELNASTWTPVAGNPKFTLNSFDCGAPGHCAGIKDHLGKAAVFSGGHWIPAGLPDEWVRTTAVSCPSATLCRATDRQGRTFDLVNDTWSAGRQLVPATGLLRHVSCASRHWCMAIDGTGNALRWHDGHWSKPQPMDKNRQPPATAISCTPDRVCTVVTTSLDALPALTPQGEAIRYVHGHWQPPTVIDPNHEMIDVSCPTASYCAAVDWNGGVVVFRHGSWSAPHQVFQPSFQRAIDCAAPARCVSVGTDGTLVSHGNVWKHVPQPKHAEFYNVDCVDTAFCVGNDGGAELHAGVWGPVAPDAFDVGPSCASRTFCVAIRDEYGTHDLTFNGAAGRRSHWHHGRDMSCAPGPLCVEIYRDGARVGRP